jgi:hypothetical protein
MTYDEWIHYNDPTPKVKWELSRSDKVFLRSLRITIEENHAS